MTELSLSVINRFGGTQPRARLDDAIIQEYAEAMIAGDVFPPVTTFHDGAVYWLADGFHRVNAALRAGRETIEATVHQGTQRDAILWSISANATHGLRRTNEDKRRAVTRLLQDPECAGLAVTVDQALLGRRIDIRHAGEWVGPFLVVDVGTGTHRAGLVGEVGFEIAMTWRIGRPWWTCYRRVS